MILLIEIKTGVFFVPKSLKKRIAHPQKNTCFISASYYILFQRRVLYKYYLNDRITVKDGNIPTRSRAVKYGQKRSRSSDDKNSMKNP